MASTTSFSGWDFHNYHVQQELTGGQFVSAESTLIAAGKPELETSPSGAGASPPSDSDVYPIGLLESFGLQQNKQLQRIFEIGSSRSYFVPGRTIGSFSLGRTFYFGPSLLRVLYAYYNQSTAAANSDFTTGANQAISAAGKALALDPYAALLNEDNSSHQVIRSPGEGYFWIDLASDLFAQPTGMAVYFKDTNDDTLGAFYLEDSYVQSHQLNVSSGSVLVMEGASLQYDQIKPIKIL
jgi:hypothetical protein